MTHLRFGIDFIRWTMSCISSISFSILINGVATSFFSFREGVQQGCPLSLLVFLLVDEGLSRFLFEARSSKNFGGVQILHVLYISHLLFVDGILIFCDGSRRYTNKLIEGLELFKIANRMLVNANNSTLSCNLMEEGEMAYMATKLPFLMKDLDSGIKYLGFQLKPNDYRKEYIGNGWLENSKRGYIFEAIGGCRVLEDWFSLNQFWKQSRFNGYWCPGYPKAFWKRWEGYVLCTFGGSIRRKISCHW